MYSAGRGVARDLAAAVQWFRKAANSNYATAEFNLGLMYSKGMGVTQDRVEAAKWFRKAGAHGLRIPKNELSSRYQRGERQELAY
jgi:TPR repeat protein